MEISTIIPAYNRVEDLNKALNSILIQTFLPKEVIVIDNSNKDRDKIKKLVEHKVLSFKTKNIYLRYIYNEKENSLTTARNLGVNYASNEIISFLDDDLILDKEYYKNIKKVFEEHPHALGVMGQTIFYSKKNKIKFLISQLLGKIFYLGFNEINKCRVLPSLGVTSPLADKIINCEWISGASSYRKKVFNEFKFDEKLKKYSIGEDTDFSHRVFKKYPYSLFMTPWAKYIHTLSLQGRNPKKELAYMEEVYYLYIFYKIIPQNFINKMIYLWSRIGNVIFKTISCISGRLSFLEIKYSFEAYIFCLKHLREIKKGDLDFLNKTLNL